MSTVAVRITTTNDSSGNPRRGWLVYTADAVTRDAGFRGFVDEGYGGHAALRRAFPDAIEICSLTVPAAEYRQAMIVGRPERFGAA